MPRSLGRSSSLYNHNRVFCMMSCLLAYTSRKQTDGVNSYKSFKEKIDELLSEGYDPVLDDGVGKNIAPLQKKKMITYEVLNPGQLKKYLNADW